MLLSNCSVGSLADSIGLNNKKTPFWKDDRTTKQKQKQINKPKPSERCIGALSNYNILEANQK